MELSVNNNNPNFGRCMNPERAAMRKRFVNARKEGDAFYYLAKKANTEEECNYIARRLFDPVLRFFSLDRNNGYKLAKQKLVGFKLDKQYPELAERFNVAKNLKDILNLVQDASSAGECTYIANKIDNNIKCNTYFEGFDNNVIELARGKARIFSCIDECSDSKTKDMVYSIIGKSLTESNFPKKFDEDAFRAWAKEMNLPEPWIKDGVAVFYDNDGNIVRKIYKDNACDNIRKDGILLLKDGYRMGLLLNEYGIFEKIYIDKEKFEPVKNQWASDRLQDRHFLYPEIPYDHFYPSYSNPDSIRKVTESNNYQEVVSF